MGLFDLFDGAAGEKKRLEKDIANYENRKASLDLQLDGFIAKIRDLEAQIKVLRPEYDSAHGAEKTILAAKIKPLLQELEQMKEKEQLVSKDLKDLTTLIHNAYLQLQHLENPDMIDKLEIAAEDRDNLSREVRDRTKAGDQLRGIPIEGDDDSEPDFGVVSSEDDLLGKQMDSALGIEHAEKKDELSEI